MNAWRGSRPEVTNVGHWPEPRKEVGEAGSGVPPERPGAPPDAGITPGGNGSEGTGGPPDGYEDWITERDCMGMPLMAVANAGYMVVAADGRGSTRPTADLLG